MKIIILISGVLALLISSCQKKQEPTGNEEARLLFNKSVELIIKVNQEISQAKDTITVDSILKCYEKLIAEINFSFPPQTDYKLTEQENDSIFKLMKAMKRLQKEKLESFADNPVDSLIIENVDS